MIPKRTGQPKTASGSFFTAIKISKKSVKSGMISPQPNEKSVFSVVQNAVFKNFVNV